MSEWQPIDSAPRDEAVLVTFAKGDIAGGVTSCGVMVAFFDPYYALGGRGYDGGSGWIAATEGGECRSYYGEPTHWMPLPAPPQTEDMT